MAVFHVCSLCFSCSFNESKSRSVSVKLPSLVFTDTEPFLLLNKRGKHLTLIASTTHSNNFSTKAEFKK